VISGNVFAVFLSNPIAMIRFSLFLILIFFILSGSISKEKNSELLWDEGHKLEWQDFRGTINPKSRADAAATVSIRAMPYKKNRALHYHVDAVFIRDHSWCKSPSTDLLAHEQLHFDIAELYARKIRRKISDYKRLGIKDVKMYNKAIQEILTESNEADMRYDRETVHGAIAKRQTNWEEMVRLELQLLSPYKRSQIR
jgi:hypothetical protein